VKDGAVHVLSLSAVPDVVGAQQLPPISHLLQDALLVETPRPILPDGTCVCTSTTSPSR